MKEHLEKFIENFREEISRKVYFPAQHHPFTINNRAVKLNEERRYIFSLRDHQFVVSNEKGMPRSINVGVFYRYSGI